MPRVAQMAGAKRQNAKFGKPRGHKESPPWHSSIAVMTRPASSPRGRSMRSGWRATLMHAGKTQPRPLRSSSTNVRHERNNILQVFVRDNNVDQALKVLKRRLQREGVFREMKRRRFYEKPSERSARERGEAVRCICKLKKRKQAQREGFIAPAEEEVAGGRSLRLRRAPSRAIGSAQPRRYGMARRSEVTPPTAPQLKMPDAPEVEVSEELFGCCPPSEKGRFRLQVDCQTKGSRSDL